jgi:hypothetical protein
MPYLSNGDAFGGELTGGLVPVTDHDPAIIRRISNPQLLDPNNPASEIYSKSTWSRIGEFRERRANQHRQSSKLPSEKKALEHLEVARASKGFERLSLATLPKTVAAFFPGRPELATVNDGLLLQCLQRAHIALTAFAAGVGISAQLSIGGFDTHADQDITMPDSLGRLFLVLDYVYSHAAALGILDRLNVLVTSDFGRGPTYNDTMGSGKAHWPVSSMLVSGPGIEGGRTLGFSSSDYLPRAVDASDPTKADMLGEIITPAHVIFELRRHLKMVGTTLDQVFPLYVPKPIRMW